MTIQQKFAFFKIFRLAANNLSLKFDLVWLSSWYKEPEKNYYKNPSKAQQVIERLSL